jgi:hypothetical protein
MAEEPSFTDYPIHIQRLATNYLGLSSPGGAPEASMRGSEGTESSETTERSESSENSESTETTERKETAERFMGLVGGPAS